MTVTDDIDDRFSHLAVGRVAEVERRVVVD